MTDLLKELRRLAQAATPGPWKWRGGYDYLIGGDLHTVHTPKQYEDAAFIAAANPQTILALCDALEAAMRGLEHIADRASRRDCCKFAALNRYRRRHLKESAAETLAEIRKRLEKP